MHENDENALCFQEEMLALSSIYGDDLTYLNDSGRYISIRLRSNGEEMLLIEIPEGYPSAGVHVKSDITAPSLRGDPKTELLEKLRLIAEKKCGQGLLFDLVEAAKDFCEDHLPHLNPTSMVTPCDLPTSDSCKVLAANAPECSKLSVLTHHNLDIEIFHGTPFTERRSTFQAHFAIVTDVAQVKIVLDQLKSNRKIAEATHNMMAYRIVGSNGHMMSDCDDDGESQAGSRLLHLLNLLDVTNVVLVVSRWFGGILLGPERFKHITNAARNILKDHRVIA